MVHERPAGGMEKRTVMLLDAAVNLKALFAVSRGVTHDLSKTCSYPTGSRAGVVAGKNLKFIGINRLRMMISLAINLFGPRDFMRCLRLTGGQDG
jgi:hypothetical protein